MIWFWGFKVTVRVRVKATAIRRGFELYECLLVPVVFSCQSQCHQVSPYVLEYRLIISLLWTHKSLDSPSVRDDR